MIGNLSTHAPMVLSIIPDMTINGVNKSGMHKFRVNMEDQSLQKSSEMHTIKATAQMTF